MHNPLSLWLTNVRNEIRSHGVWAVISSVITAVVVGTLHHWFYGKTLDLVQRIPRAIAFLQPLLVYSIRNPVGITVIVFFCVIAALAIHAYFAGDDAGLWLEYDPSQPYSKRPLRVQNSGKKTVYDVVVKIPANGTEFVSDSIPRLVNDRSWVVCTSNGVTETHEKTINRIVGAMLAGNLETQAEPVPVLISFRNGTQELEIKTPLVQGIKFSLPEPRKKNLGAA